MSLIHAIDWLYTFSGFCVGLFVGMTGTGGGSLMTPILILLFGVHPATAVGTDLLYSAAAKTVGTLVHGYTRNIDWRIVCRLATGSVPMTVVTPFILSHADLAAVPAGRLIICVLSAALLATVVALVFLLQLIDCCGRHAGRATMQPRPRHPFSASVRSANSPSWSAGAAPRNSFRAFLDSLPTRRETCAKERQACRGTRGNVRKGAPHENRRFRS